MVIGVGPEPRSYTIKCSITRRELPRNRQLIHPRNSPAPSIDIPCELQFSVDEEIEKADTSIQEKSYTASSPPVTSKPTTQQTPQTPTQQAQASQQNPPTSPVKALMGQPVATVPVPVTSWQ